MVASNSRQARLILIGTALLLTLGWESARASGFFWGRSRATRGRRRPISRCLLQSRTSSGASRRRWSALIADRIGLRITMIAGAAIYVVGLGIMAAAQGALALIVSGGLIGVALSCTATSLAMTACVRAVSPEQRSKTLGLVAAVGIARHPRGAADHPGAARARAVADRRGGFRTDGGGDDTCRLSGRRR